MARGDKRTLVQRIALDGGDDIRKELEALGRDGEKAFRALKKAADELRPATEGLGRDLVNLRNQFGLVRERVGALGNQFSSVTRTMATFAANMAAVFSVRALIDMTSTWTDLTARVRLAIPEFEDVDEVMTRLQETARTTYSSLEDTIEGFVQNSAVLRELGLTTQQQLDFQAALNNALVVSGAKAQTAASVTQSLTRAMSLGVLRGENLNNVLQNGGRIAQLLADHFGVTRGELLLLGQQGQITGDVIQEVLLGNMQQLQEEAESMPGTIQDAFVLIRNALLAYVGEADQASGLSAALAEALIWVADNMDLVANAALALVAAFVLVRGVALAQALIGIGAALVGLIPPLAAVATALLANPIILFTTLAIAAAAAIMHMTGTLDDFVAGISSVLEPISQALTGVTNFGEEGQEAIDGAEGSVNQFDDTVRNTLDGLIKMGEGGAEVGQELGTMGEEGVEAAENVSDAIKGTTSSVQELTAAVNEAISSLRTLGSMGGGSGSTPSVQSNAQGGPIRGPGTGTSDSILSWLSNGEYVLKARAVRKYGVGFLNALNSMRLPAFNMGGFVDGLTSGMGVSPMAMGVMDGAGSGGGGRPIHLTIGDETFEMSAPDDVAEKLQKYSMGRQVRSAGRRPNWYGGK